MVSIWSMYDDVTGSLSQDRVVLWALSEGLSVLPRFSTDAGGVQVGPDSKAFAESEARHDAGQSVGSDGP